MEEDGKRNTEKIEFDWEVLLPRSRRDDDPPPKLVIIPTARTAKRKRSPAVMASDQREHYVRNEVSGMTDTELNKAIRGKKNTQKIELNWAVLLPRRDRDDDPPPELLVAGAAERKQSSVAMGSDQQEHYVRNEFSGLTDRQLEVAIKNKRSSYNTVGKNLRDKGENLLNDLKGLQAEKEHRKRSRVEKDNAFLKATMGEKHVCNIHGDKDETGVEEGSNGRVTSFPQLAQVVDEMKISLSRMQSQVDSLTEQVGGFAQRLEAYNDHFAAMRRQLDYYFPYPPPPPPPRSQ